MNKKKFLALLLVVASLLTLAACKPGNNGDDGTNGTGGTDDGGEYKYAEANFNGDPFRIMNIRPTWDMRTEIDFESDDGDKLNSAIYKRNRFIEQKYSTKIKSDEEISIYDTADEVLKFTSSGDDMYDITYVGGELISSLIADDQLYDLSKIKNLQLDQDWWNQYVNEQAKLGKDANRFYAMSDLSLTGFDLTWALIFNATMMENLGEVPADLYETVRNKQWTHAELMKYTALGASLEEDSNFSWNQDGTCIYGLTTYGNFVVGAMNGAQAFVTSRNEADGTINLEMGNDRFNAWVDEFVKLSEDPGQFAIINGDMGHYEAVFKSGRALFVGAEIKAASTYRDMEDKIGLVPVPMLNEEQDSYVSNTNYLAPLFCIPKTCVQVDRAAAVADALSYLSMEDVLPMYYEVTLSQKAYRGDSDAIEMLDIIRGTRYYEASLAYGWTKDLMNEVIDKLCDGDDAVQSDIDNNREAILYNANEFIAKLNNK